MGARPRPTYRRLRTTRDARHATHDEGTPVRWLPMIAVVIAFVLVVPVWPWSRGWSWVPAGMVGVILATILLFTYSFLPA